MRVSALFSFVVLAAAAAALPIPEPNGANDNGAVQSRPNLRVNTGNSVWSQQAQAGGTPTSASPSGGGPIVNSPVSASSPSPPRTPPNRSQSLPPSYAQATSGQPQHGNAVAGPSRQNLSPDEKRRIEESVVKRLKEQTARQARLDKKPLPALPPPSPPYWQGPAMPGNAPPTPGQRFRDVVNKAKATFTPAKQPQRKFSIG